MAVAASLTDTYTPQFDAFAAAHNGGEAEWIRTSRRAALRSFRELGWPTLKQEDWKHTDVRPLAKIPFHVESSLEPPKIAGDLVDPYTFGVLKCSQLVFLNGRFAPKLSYLRWLPDGVRVRSLAEVRATRPMDLEPLLGRVAPADKSAFTALNAAFMQDGAFVHIPRGQVVEEPIHILHVAVGTPEPQAFFPRNLILLEPEAQATVIESYVGLDKTPYLTDALTEIVVGDAAVLDHYKMQREGEAAYHVSETALRQGRSSNVSSAAFTFGGLVSRSDVDTLFAGEGADLTLNGLYVLQDSQHADSHTFIDHAPLACASRELFKGILDARSRGIFYGKILVRAGAQKSNARQTNKNLLLSKEAFADSTPGLEILADDVKCTHGSTVGQLDENAVFYLRSRGIDEDAARSMLTYAFAAEIINAVKVASMRIKLDQLLLSRLPRTELLAQEPEGA